MRKYDPLEVDKFVNHFHERRNDVDTIICNSSEIIKKILYLNIADSLSKATFPQTDQNKNRFVTLIDKFGGWKDGEKVSLPFLKNDLSVIKRDDFEELKNFVNSELEKWPIRSPVQITLASDAVEKFIIAMLPPPKKNEKYNPEIFVKKYCHYSLLWEYRNCLVHEFRQPGYGHELEEDTFPFYEAAYPSLEIRLCYPTRFISKLVETIIDNLREHFHTNKINPYNSFTYGAFWNKKN